MRGDGIAMGEAPVIRWQSATIFELNADAGIDGANNYQFAVCDAQSSVTTVRGEQEPITGRHLNRLCLQDIEAPYVPPGDSGFLSVCRTNHAPVCCSRFNGRVKAQQLPWAIVLQVSLLHGCPVKRDVPCKGCALAEFF